MGKEEFKVTKKSKKQKQKIPTLDHDPYLMRINKGEKLYKLFLLNPSFGLNTIWKIIAAFMDEETSDKI